jgi:HxlR-like helix-turn-helix
VTRRPERESNDAADRGAAPTCGTERLALPSLFFGLAIPDIDDYVGRMSASYGQFCPIAKASEIFATRWTPLIAREVMTGVHSFNDIHRGVPLVSRAVLVARLRELEGQV